MKKAKVVLPDTNAILRYLLHDHEEHFVQASELFEAIREDKRQAIVLEGVLVECIYVLTKFYQVPRTEAAGKLHDLLQYKGMRNSDRQELLNALKCYSETKIDIVDCILLAKGSDDNTEVFSFDSDLRPKQT